MIDVKEIEKAKKKNRKVCIQPGGYTQGNERIEDITEMQERNRREEKDRKEIETTSSRETPQTLHPKEKRMTTSVWSVALAGKGA